MNIQNSPKQIALTNEQINGIKNKYTNMVGVVENITPAPEVQVAVEEPPVVQEPNMFDATPSNGEEQVAIAPEQGTAFNPTPVQEEQAVSPEVGQAAQNSVLDNASAPVSTPEVQVDNNMFNQTEIQPTNAEIIGENQNVFETNNVFDSAPSQEPTPASEPASVESVQNNVFDVPVAEPIQTVQEPQVINNSEPAVVNNDVNSIESLKSEYNQIVNSAAALNEMINNFGQKLASYGIDNNVQFLNQNVNANEFNNNQNMHM